MFIQFIQLSMVGSETHNNIRVYMYDYACRPEIALSGIQGHSKSSLLVRQMFRMEYRRNVK